MFPNIEHRGRDSWGWIHHRGDSGTIQLRKFAEPASEGIAKVRPEHRFGIPNDVNWWIGHVRFATHGSKDYTHNNHPIVHGDIMGVHNGICYNYKKILAETGRQHKKAEVDSEAIFAAIHKYGVVEGLDMLDALAATVFINRNEPGKVYFATCDANPLIIGRSKNGATYFASESWILEELKVEWEEAPWMMADYSLYILKDGVEESYVQYADPMEKSRKGWGSPSYSSYGGYTYQGGSTTNTQRSHAWDEDDMVWYDSQTGAMGSRQAPLGTTVESSDGVTLLADSIKDDEFDVECLNCCWTGDDWDCDDGLCPKCGSTEWLVPYGMLTDATKEDIQSNIDFDPNQEFLQELVHQLRTPELVVVDNGRVVTREDFDAYQTATKVLGTGEGDI